MPMKPLPASTLEVVKADLLFELLMRLLADPACLDGRCQCAQVGLRRKVGEIILLFTRAPVFADKPNFPAGQMLLAFVPDPLRWPVGDPHAQGGETRLESPFRAKTPADLAPLSLPQHLLGRPRQDVRNRLTGASTSNRWGDHLYIGGVDFEMTRNADSPVQFANHEFVAERGTLAIAGIRQHAAKAHTCCKDAIKFLQRD